MIARSNEKSLYEQSFTQCMNLWEDNPEVLPLTFHPKISEAAATLIGVPALRLWHDQALYKDAGGRYTEPHQDQPYWPMDEIDTLSAWITFDGSTRENGCMAYVPGSHLIGLRKFVNIFTADEKVKILEEPQHRGDRAGLCRGAARQRRVSSRLDGASRGSEQKQSHPPRSYDDLLPRWRDAHQAVRASERRSPRHQGRRGDR